MNGSSCFYRFWRHLKHGLVGKATKLRAWTLWGSMADIHLMERLDEGI